MGGWGGACLRAETWPQELSWPKLTRCARPEVRKTTKPEAGPSVESTAPAQLVTSCSQVRMGMPTLKRFARPLDWAGIDAALRRYAREVRKASASGQEAPQPSSPPCAVVLFLCCICGVFESSVAVARLLVRSGGGGAAAASIGAAAARGDEEVPPLKAGSLGGFGRVQTVPPTV